MSLAIYVPVGPASLEVERLYDLLDSIAFHEPQVSTLILVDDSGRPSRLRGIHKTYRHQWETFVVANPRRGQGAPHTGGLCAATLRALKEFSDRVKADFLIKLDTDSLVIGPFFNSVKSQIDKTSSCGLLGVIGLSSNPRKRSGRDIELNRRELNTALTMPQSYALMSNKHRAQLDKWGIRTPHTFRHFSAICLLLEHINSAGVALGTYCQGGGYAVSSNLISSLDQNGHLADARRWAPIECGEDVMMGIYCSALGFNTIDFSGPGEVFGVQAHGIPFTPRKLAALKYSIIHSVKNDSRFSESYIRNLFRQRRVER